MKFAKFLRRPFLIEHLRWLLLGKFHYALSYEQPVYKQLALRSKKFSNFQSLVILHSIEDNFCGIASKEPVLKPYLLFDSNGFFLEISLNFPCRNILRIYWQRADLEKLLRIYIVFTVFSQFTKQLLNSFEPWKTWNMSNFESRDLTCVTCFIGFEIKKQSFTDVLQNSYS